MLNSLGLVVDPVLKSLCCEACEVSLIPLHVEKHVRGYHGCTHIHIDLTQLEKVCDDLGALRNFPPISRDETHPQYAGLRLDDGIGCTYCPYACISTSNMMKHCGEKHQSRKTPSSWPSVPVQCLDKQAHKSFFHVTPQKKLNVMQDDIYIANLQNLMYSAEEEFIVEGLNSRQISPWLLSTCWHEHIDGYNTEELRKLVAIPSKTEFPGLHEGLQLLYEFGLEAMDELPELVLQKLNTPDPAKT